MFTGEALDFVGEDRVKVIVRTVEKRIHILRELAMAQRHVAMHDVVEGDSSPR